MFIFHWKTWGESTPKIDRFAFLNATNKTGANTCCMKRGGEMKRSSVPPVLWKPHGKMKQFKDERYAQPSPKQEPNLFSLVRLSRQNFTTWTHRIKESLRLEKTFGTIKPKCQFSTTTKYPLGFFLSVNAGSGSGRKVLNCSIRVEFIISSFGSFLMFLTIYCNYTVKWKRAAETTASPCLPMLSPSSVGMLLWMALALTVLNCP